MVRFLLLVTLVTLGACNTRMLIDSGSDSVNTLAIGETTNVMFFTNQPAIKSGLGLTTGGSYQLSFTVLSNWADGEIDKDESGSQLSENGFSNDKMPWYAPSFFKRSGSHQWFELMLYQLGCAGDSLQGISDLNYNATSQSYMFTASCDGELKFFVNDSQGFYINNTGFTNVSITRTS